MTALNFDRALSLVLADEGGFTKIRSDPGNWTGGKVGVGQLKGTKYGIAANTFPDLDIEHLTMADVGPIYREKYWDKIHGDELPTGLDYAVFDFAVNSGMGRAIPYLQNVVGVTADGVIGPATIAACTNSDTRHFIEALCDRRLAFLKHLGTWATFGKGWSRRVESVRKNALAMVGTTAPAPTPAQPVQPPKPVPPSPIPSTYPPKPAGLVDVLVAFLKALFGVK